MKRFTAAALGWTIGSFLVLLLVGAPIDDPGCGVGDAVQAACQHRLATANAARWANHTLPMLLAIAAGYVIIAVVALLVARRGRRRRSHLAPSQE